MNEYEVAEMIVSLHTAVTALKAASLTAVTLKADPATITDIEQAFRDVRRIRDRFEAKLKDR